MTPRFQVFDLLSVREESVVVSKLHNGVGAVCGHTVVCEQEVEERAEHAALRGSGVED